ncbi:adenylosuccinate lyase family protein [Pseudooceanicola sp. 216_PA32_1]|uniref:Adenylosuccinate lyase family protein n=1 Tax=Pseudooceanicola pacificus TaxID=2676438 RepID=A0A844WDN0_9RHOB|nr:lyase family protein [Pseudooceanicola pacificus]MWB79633.1 adenylosuccinate lyase family protein [Pseudooceanicola pacificus]
MAGSVFDSGLYGKLFGAGEAGRLFTDSAEVRAMLLVEGTLAKVQGRMGLIPEISAAAIHRATLEITLDPSGLATATAQNGVPVPGLVAAFRKEMQAPEHAQYLHWGATSQDIHDTGLMLRLRQLLVLLERDLRALLSDLAALAETHAELPMPGRTYGQHATAVSFGSVVAHWGWPLVELVAELEALRRSALWVSLSGAAGTGAAFGPQAGALRAALAEGLGLGDPGRSWHADRGPVLRIAGWLARVATALAKMGEDLVLLTQSGIGELRLGTSGGSSTMPQKQNPVAPSVLIALARQAVALNGALLSAGAPRQERDGGAWFTEWLSLPQLCLCAASAVETARGLRVEPVPGAMAEALELNGGVIHAEALSFRLAEHMGRPEAQAAVKEICKRVAKEGRPLAALAGETWPEVELGGVFDARQQLGEAPGEARGFARAVRAL